MIINEEYIQELKLKNNIVDVVGRKTPLIRRGGSYWANCPLPGHNERTPSFSVNENGQYYKCFGCGRGGDVIKFVQEVESCDFFDAVRILAERVGMELPEKTAGEVQVEKQTRERLLSVLHDTALFYVKNLKNPLAKEHNAYLNKRNVGANMVTAFGLGASLDWEGLPNYLLSKGYTYEEMTLSGVCYKGENGKYIDSQGKRLIYPIIDNYDKVIAFGGRVLVQTKQGKYKNTSDTKIFYKNKNLYNINNIKKLKKELGTIENLIIVEGYMDTIALYKAGIRNVVASMGTSLTVEQAKLAKRYTEKVTICYDGDFAGQKGTIRGLEILKAQGLDVRVATLFDGLDPDDIINKYGVERFNEVILDATTLIEYKLRLVNQKYGQQSSTPDKLKLISKSIEVIKGCDSVSEQEDLLKKLRDMTGITYESLKRDLENIDGVVTTKEEKKIVPIQMSIVTDKVKQAQRYLLYSVLFKKEYASEIELEDYIFTDPVHEKLAQLIIEKNIIVAELGGLFSSEELGEIEKILSQADYVPISTERKYFNDCLKTIRIDEIEKEIKSLNDTFDDERDISTRQMLVKKIQSLSMELIKLKNRR